jgi:hypothetical protein
MGEPSEAARQAFFPNFAPDALDSFDYSAIEDGLEDLSIGTSADFKDLTDASAEGDAKGITDEYLNKVQKTYFEGIEAVDEQVKKQVSGKGKQGPSPYPLFQGI